MADSARTAALYGDTHLMVFTFNADTGIKSLIGEAKLTTDVETIENPALLDTSKRVHSTIVGHTLSFEVSGDTGCLLDFQSLAIAKAPIALILQFGVASPAKNWYRAGNFIITSCEEQIGEAIRLSVTAVCVGDLDLTA